MEEHIDKAILLDNMSAAHDALEKTLTPLNEAQMTTPGVNGEWSIKDLLVHLTAWQQRLLAAIRAGEPAISPLDISGEEVNGLNQQFYQENKSRSLNAVLAAFRTASSQLLASVEAMTDEDLIDPQRFSWTGGKPLWQFVAGETYEHILEHIGSIYTWQAKVKQDATHTK